NPYRRSARSRSPAVASPGEAVISSPPAHALLQLVLAAAADRLQKSPQTERGANGVGWPGASQPPAPEDPGVTVSRHRAPLTSRSAPADPPPVGEQTRFSFEHPGPPPLEPLVGTQPSVLLPCPAPQVDADAP